jgi:hypothetical protein
VNETRELLLAERGLHVAIAAASAKSEARDPHTRLAKRDYVGGCAGRGVQRQSAHAADCSNGKRCLEEFAAGKWFHQNLLIRAARRSDRPFRRCYHKDWIYRFTSEYSAPPLILSVFLSSSIRGGALRPEMNSGQLTQKCALFEDVDHLSYIAFSSCGSRTILHGNFCFARPDSHKSPTLADGAFAFAYQREASAWTASPQS